MPRLPGRPENTGGSRAEPSLRQAAWAPRSGASTGRWDLRDSLSECSAKTPTSRLTSKDDSNSSTKVLLEGLGAPGAACRSEAWPGSPGGGGWGPAGCPENIPPRDPAMSAMARGNATEPACAAGSRSGRGHVTEGASVRPTGD